MRREAGLRGEDPYQCVKNVAVFSISMFGTLKEMTSYGSAAKSRYWYLRSQGSFFCSKALMKRCLGLPPSSISGYSTYSTGRATSGVHYPGAGTSTLLTEPVDAHGTPGQSCQHASHSCRLTAATSMIIIDPINVLLAVCITWQ